MYNHPDNNHPDNNQVNNHPDNNQVNSQPDNNRADKQTPVLKLRYIKDDKNRLILEEMKDTKDKAADLAGKRLDIVIYSENSSQERIFPVFQQKAHTYGAYSVYMERHGCACCSLTTILAAYCKQWKELRPDQAIEEVERNQFDAGVFEKNYGKIMARQMPVSLYGISVIMSEYGIRNRYVGAFEDRKAYRQIRKHLYEGKPVVIEASRFRRKNGLIVRLNDKKYAGSYHTMILLGFTSKGKVLFTDSAGRSWAGSRQRIKETSLKDVLNYMFPRKNEKDTHVYFSRRRNTGGYILVDEDIGTV